MKKKRSLNIAAMDAHYELQVHKCLPKEELRKRTRKMYGELQLGIAQLERKLKKTDEDKELLVEAKKLAKKMTWLREEVMKNEKEGDVVVITYHQVESARATLPPYHGAFFRMNCNGLVAVSQHFHLDRQCELLAASQAHLIKEHENDAILITRSVDGPAGKKCHLQDRPLCEGCNGYVAGYEEDVMIHGQVALPVGPRIRHKTA